jgi:flagellar motor protein MotB
LLGHTNSPVIIIVVVVVVVCAIHAIEVVKLQIIQKIFNTPNLLLQKSTEHIHVNLASARQEEEEEYQRELPVQKTSISLQSLSPPEICIMPQHQQNKPTAYTGL